MMFQLFGFDFFMQEKLFGFWFCGIKNCESINRHLFSVYYMAGDLFIEAFWIRIFTKSLTF
jgi:hypothetical protein